MRVLGPLQPYLRGAPLGLPFRFDREAIQTGLNFTLRTTVGDLDLLGEITRGGNYHDLLPHCDTIDLFGRECRCLGLKKLIAVKRATGCPKDNEVLAELERLLEESGNR